MKEKLDEFHRLVAEGKYRAARGVLETETDISPAVAQKWLTWLEALHHDEWIQAGATPDLKKRDPDRARRELGKMIGGTIAVIIAAVLLWLIVNRVMTYETAHVPTGAVFLLLALISGYLGWQRAGVWIAPQHSFIAGGIVAAALLIYLLTSGFPMWYFYEPPLTYRLAAFLLVAPGAGLIVYRAGAWLGLRVVRLLHPDAI